MSWIAQSASVHMYMYTSYTALITTVGHRPFPVQLVHVADQYFISTDKMAARKKRDAWFKR